MTTTETPTPAVPVDDGLLRVDLACVAGGATLTFDQGDVSRGCRYLSAYYDAPDLSGRIGGCRFGRLHVEVKETGQASGEWRVSVSRTSEGQTYGWDQLTDKARSAFLAEVGLAFSHTRTSTAWLAAFKLRRHHGAADAKKAAEQAMRVARWWARVEMLEDGVRMGLWEVVMLPQPEDRRERRVDVVDRSREGSVSWEPVVGEVIDWATRELHRRGDEDFADDTGRRGWVTESGRLVPTEDRAPLRAPRT